LVRLHKLYLPHLRKEYSQMDEPNNQYRNQQTGLQDKEHPVLDDDHREEFAAEAIDDDMDVPIEAHVPSEETNDLDIRNVYGWIGVALSVISFFMIPLLFAGAGIILGL